MKLTRRYTISIAHSLPAAGMESARVHGHTVHVGLIFEGDPHPEYRWVIDGAVVDEAWQSLRSRFDHRCLNDIGQLGSMPTMEALACFVLVTVRRHPRIILDARATLVSVSLDRDLDGCHETVLAHSDEAFRMFPNAG